MLKPNARKREFSFHMLRSTLLKYSGVLWKSAWDVAGVGAGARADKAAICRVRARSVTLILKQKLLPYRKPLFLPETGALAFQLYNNIGEKLYNKYVSV